MISTQAKAPFKLSVLTDQHFDRAIKKLKGVGAIAEKGSRYLVIENPGKNAYSMQMNSFDEVGHVPAGAVFEDLVHTPDGSYAQFLSQGGRSYRIAVSRIFLYQ